LGTHTLSAKDLIINHSSGSGIAASITKGGSGEALTVVKTSGSGNAASITGGVTQLDELHLTTDLADSYISSAATWNAKQEPLVSGTNIKTINGSSVLGSGDLVVSATANPSVIALTATNGTAVTGTIIETISQSLLIPANTFTTDGILEVLGRILKTGASGNQSFRIYKNTTSSLTGATLIGLILSPNSALYCQGIRTYRINSNTLTGFPSVAAAGTDYAQNANTETSTTFNTSVDNYIIFAIQLTSILDSSVVRMAIATKYI
jgi:hypothetical protein